MENPYNLLDGVLTAIENKLRDGINVDIIADEFDVSSRHLQRLFKLAFMQSLGLYIRSRKLAASIDDLLNSNLNILDIALDYGFEYEQSYIRSFKREYGITPGDLRKTGKTLKITPPLNLFNSQKKSDGIMFGPEIVIVPKFHVIGKKRKTPFRDALYLSTNGDCEEFSNYNKIKNVVNSDFNIYISQTAGGDADYCFTMSAVQVNTPDYIPVGLDSFTFETSICARFRFIGYDKNKHNMSVGEEMYKAIDNFMDDKNQKYFLERKRVNVDRIYSSNEDGFYLWEWFAPVMEKASMKIPSFSPSGIKKMYRQNLPALRFVGKKYTGNPTPWNILDLLDNWQIHNMFYDIEKRADIDYKTFFDGGDSYISLVKKNDDGVFEHWMGMFMPQGTEVPQGYDMIDFPEMTISVCRMYGKRNEIIDYDTECRNKLAEDCFDLKNENLGSQCYFRRFNWHRFFEEDIYGKRLLDYCYFVA